MRRWMMLLLVCVVVVGCVGVVAASWEAQTPEPAPGQQPPVFRTGVELVAVDVTVLDKEGRPVRDLMVDDFILQVDGKPRRLVSATFVPLGTTARPSGVVTRPAHYSTNAGAVGGRLVVFVVDRGNIRRGEGRPLVQAAGQFITGLDAADRVALAVIPDANSNIDFTTNHQAIRRQIETMLGGSTPLMTKFTISSTEALAIVREDQRTLEQVASRECQVAVLTAPLQAREATSEGGAATGGGRLRQCEMEVKAEARLVYWNYRQQTAASLVALKSLFERLALTSGPKTVVLLSEGMFVDNRERGDFESLAEVASEADVTLYALGLDVQDTDASTTTISPTFNADRVLRKEGLEMLVGMTRGRLFSIATGARSAFDRIGREMSGYYVLAFEPEADDRQAGVRSIDVDVRRPGVEVRSRRHFLVESGAASRPTKDVLAEVLRSPLPATDLLMRTATFVYPSDGKQLRVIISAEVEGATADGAVPCGFALTNAKGEVVGAELEGPNAAARPRGDLHAYLASFVLDPGKYTLKLAAVDALGRRGSVEHELDARLTPAGQLRVGDLMLADAPAGRSRDIRPSIETRMVSDEVIGYLELASDVPSQLAAAGVVFEVAASDEAAALDRTEARIESPSVGRRVVEGRLPTDRLPPGEYIARASVSVGGRVVAKPSRPFRVERPLVTNAAGPRTGAPAGARSTSQTRLRGPAAIAGVDPFAAERVLSGEVVGFFLDRMPRVEGGPLQAAVASAATAAREGRFDAVEPALADAPDTDLTAAFLRGLVRLSRGELNPAAQQFRKALEISSEFFPATFYLGACYAAGGRDDEAAGAWQTALVSDDRATFAYELLGDALLRLEEGEQAVDIMAEARTQWPTAAGVTRRLAVAQAVARQHAEAMVTLDAYLASRPDDRDAWLLGLWLLYDAHLSGKPLGSPEEEASRFGRFRERYAALGGTQLALVDEWKRAMR